MERNYRPQETSPNVRQVEFSTHEDTPQRENLPLTLRPCSLSCSRSTVGASLYLGTSSGAAGASREPHSHGSAHNHLRHLVSNET